MPKGWLSDARDLFHARALNGLLTRSEAGVPSNADKASRPSVDIANAIIDQIGSAETAPKIAGQTAGANFEDLCADFIRSAVENFLHLRPGHFVVTKGGAIAQFDQYAHLEDLDAIAKTNKEIATAIGSDYLIKPDIVVARYPEDDAVINATVDLVDQTAGLLSPLRKVNNPLQMLHASISCKWTLRSDRAQNARSEGLNLVRNRKGRLPNIAVITAEPMPTRIASLALGTGDIDCVYHFALYEMRRAIIDQNRLETLELLDMMTEGKRLRDIADLPLDLLT